VLVQLGHIQWQTLRAVLRAEADGQSPLGRELRLTPTRKTKDGTFLDEIVSEELLVTVGKPEKPNAADEPPQFRRRYKLTPKGREAAEYGEYDRPFTPREAPLVGMAAELVESLTVKWPTPPVPTPVIPVTKPKGKKKD
jgi:hypothetical protein